MINNEIKSDVVNVVGDTGLTKMTLDEAIKLAEETGEDVVVVNDSKEIPVVKIMDYNKYLYEKQKKEKENRKKSRLASQDTKEIHIGCDIAEHDLCIKAKTADRLLSGGDKVKLVIRYKGRTIRKINEGPGKLQELANKVSVTHKIEKTPKIDGNTVSMILSPCK